MTIGTRMMSLALGALAMVGALVVSNPAAKGDDEPVLRAGLIGLDTSHVIAFTRVLNAEDAEGPLARVKVVAGYPGGSPDIASSRDRVEGYTNQLRDEYGVEIVDSIEELLEKVDVVFLESVDGRPHLEQARPVIAAGKPLFIDKPLAGSLADAVEIARLAQEAGVPCWSSSSLRFQPQIEAAKELEIVGAFTYGPCSLEEHHPDLFWYGVHGVEMLFALMGPGCETVSRVQTDGTEIVTGVWKDGRVGTFRGIRDGRAGYGATVFGTEKIETITVGGGYETMLVEVCKTFLGGEPPVPLKDTVEMFAFMEAADESKRQGGAPVSVVDYLKEKESEVEARAANQARQ